jgi:hypothetical protein
MLYELRTYRAVPGRLPDVVARFRDHTSSIWTRLGITQVGYWTTVVGESNHDFTYLLAWDSMADREQRWAAFVADAEWMTARAISEQNGPLVQSASNQFLQPTEFSPLS